MLARVLLLRRCLSLLCQLRKEDALQHQPFARDIRKTFRKRRDINANGALLLRQGKVFRKGSDRASEANRLLIRQLPEEGWRLGRGQIERLPRAVRRFRRAEAGNPDTEPLQQRS
jgi:hypothetical protein